MAIGPDLQAANSSGSQTKSATGSADSRELTHEDIVYIKKCREEALIYSQVPLTSLFTGYVLYRQRAGYYNHLSFAAVVGRYLFALSSGIVLGAVAYLPLCLSRVTRIDMVDSVLQEKILRQKSNQQLDENSRLRVPDVGPNEPFRDAYLEAVRNNEGFTTYRQRREFSRQMAAQQRAPEQQSQAAQSSNQPPHSSLTWQ